MAPRVAGWQFGGGGVKAWEDGGGDRGCNDVCVTWREVAQLRAR